MKALTLWRPFPAMIFHVPEDEAKRVENRGWRPPRALVGQRIAIHAGERIDRDAMRAASTMLGMSFPPADKALDIGIIGTARIASVIRKADVDHRIFHGFVKAAEVSHADRIWHDQVARWFSGPYGWVLYDVVALPEPLSCKGRQGLWDVPAELVGRLS